MDEFIHVKDSALKDNALCGFDDGFTTWTTRESASKIATCAECLQEVIQDNCSICDGNGQWEEYHERVICCHCDINTAQEMIIKRGTAVPPPPPEGRKP